MVGIYYEKYLFPYDQLWNLENKYSQRFENKRNSNCKREQQLLQGIHFQN